MEKRKQPQGALAKLLFGLKPFLFLIVFLALKGEAMKREAIKGEAGLLSHRTKVRCYTI
jgi:hypothetical protein